MNTLLLDAAAVWWRWTAWTSMQAAVLGLCAVLLDRLLRRRAPVQLRAALWAAVAAKLILPPGFAVPLPLQSLALPAPHRTVAETPLLPAYAFGVWLAVGAALSLAALLRYRRSRRAWLSEPVEPGPRLLESAGAAAQLLGLPAVPPLRVSRSARGPAVIGFLRPLVVIPAGWMETVPAAQMEHVLLHEFAHVRRRDPLASLACLLLQLCYWFHPAAWLMRRRLAEIRELGCDQRVAGALNEQAPEYRRTLLQLARPLLREPDPAHLPFIHTHALLLERLALLEHPLHPSRPRQRAAAAALCGLLLLCCVPLAPRDAAGPPLPPWEELDGCLQKRYAILQLLARAELASTSTSNDSLPDGP